MLWAMREGVAGSGLSFLPVVIQQFGSQHKKAVSSQRYEFRIFSSLCPGECILCTLPHLRKIGFGGPWRASFPCGEQFLCFSLPLVYL